MCTMIADSTRPCPCSQPIRTQDGISALHWAASKGHTDVAEALLAVPHICVNLCTRVRNQRARQPEIERHVCVWFRLQAKSTPLHWAASSGHASVAALLLAHPDVDVNAINQVRRGITRKESPVAGATVP